MTKIQVILLCLFFPACEPLFIPDTSEDTKLSLSQAQDKINGILKAESIVGVGVSVFTKDSVLWSKGFGYSDKYSKKEFTENTVINIASITKTITATAMMLLVNDSLCKLTDDVNKYLPFKIENPYCPSQIITIEHLLTHTSGIIDREDYYDNSYHYGSDSPVDLGTYLKNYLSPSGNNYGYENYHENYPGLKYEYSNIGAGLAGYIVELISGMKLNDFTRVKFFEPLEMKNSYWFFSEKGDSLHTKLYSTVGGDFRNINLYGLTTYPDGGLRTSVNDLAKFIRCIANNGLYNSNQIIPSASVQSMLTPRLSTEQNKIFLEVENHNCGYFWEIINAPENNIIIGHNGGDPGVSTFMYYDIGKDYGAILFSNTETNSLKPLLEIWSTLWKINF